jgi:hypothetical protein
MPQTAPPTLNRVDLDQAPASRVLVHSMRRSWVGSFQELSRAWEPYYAACSPQLSPELLIISFHKIASTFDQFDV